MKINKEKADKIKKIFNVKFPQLVVTDIYDCVDGTIIRALKEPEKDTMGIPYYQLLPNNIVINANPLSRFDWFTEVTSEDNHIYHNTDIEYPEMKGVEINESNTI